MCRSGSATEIKKPSMRPATATIKTLFVFAILEPMLTPIGVMPLSTPIKKSVNPKIIKAAPIRNLMINGVAIGTMVKFNIRTMIVIGKTAYKTSFSFEIISVK